MAPGTPPALTDLGLYSITFMNDPELDRAAGERYREFRIEAERWGFKHFLEVFNPNVGSDRLSRADVGSSSTTTSCACSRRCRKPADRSS